jgi:hypothetical protein
MYFNFKCSSLISTNLLSNQLLHPLHYLSTNYTRLHLTTKSSHRHHYSAGNIVFCLTSFSSSVYFDSNSPSPPSVPLSKDILSYMIQYWFHCGGESLKQLAKLAAFSYFYQKNCMRIQSDFEHWLWFHNKSQRTRCYVLYCICIVPSLPLCQVRVWSATIDLLHYSMEHWTCLILLPLTAAHRPANRAS